MIKGLSVPKKIKTVNTSSVCEACMLSAGRICIVKGAKAVTAARAVNPLLLMSTRETSTLKF